MMSKIVVSTCLVVGLIITLYFTRANPVLYAYRESGDPRGEPKWSILHPFRDKSPERVAEATLSRISNGETLEALAGVAFTARARDNICAREVQYQMTGWKLLGREDTAGQVRLYFGVDRNQSERFDSPVWLTIKRTPMGWKVTGYESWY